MLNLARVHPLFTILTSQEINGASFISIDSETVVQLRGGKTNPHKGRVTKRVTGSNVMIFQNKTTNAYENMVHRRLKQEGKDPASFELSPRAWGTRLEGCPFVQHKEELYLEVIFLKAGTTEYFLDGQPIAKSEIIGLEDHAEGEQGGLDNKVIIRTYKCDSIRSITVNKEHYNFVKV